MPNESVSADYKERLYKVFLAMKPSRRTMVNMYNLIPKVAAKHRKELILAHCVRSHHREKGQADEVLITGKL